MRDCILRRSILMKKLLMSLKKNYAVVNGNQNEEG